MVMGYPDFSNESESNESKSVEPESVEPKSESEITKGSIMVEKFGIPYKAIIGFLTVFFGQLLARMTIDGVTVFPETMSGWGSLIGGSAFAALVIYLKANTYTVPQAQNNLVKAKARV